jgi:outer membrane protein insertion porin family
MGRNRVFAVVLFLPLSIFLSAECAKDQDHRSNKNSGLLVADLNVSGTQTLSSDELASITRGLTGSCFDEDLEDLKLRVGGLFIDRGYFGAEVKTLRIKTSDPIAIPKPAMVEAEVLEGPQYRLAEIGFEGNHAFNTDELRSKFPIKKGDLFTRDRIAAGLENLRELYLSRGFLDFTSIPNTQSPSNATVLLSVDIYEGKQFHMGRLDIFAAKELADRLRAGWQLPEGAVFDPAYVNQYVDSNRSLLPPEFQKAHVQLLRDCGDATVDVSLPIDVADPRTQSPRRSIECETPDDPK